MLLQSHDQIVAQSIKHSEEIFTECHAYPSSKSDNQNPESDYEMLYKNSLKENDILKTEINKLKEE